MKGLIIRDPWITMILEGKKIWEIRGRNTQIRGRIALIKSKTGKIFGMADLVGVKELSPKDYQEGQKDHCVPDVSKMPYKRTFAWTLENPVLFEKPIPYVHPKGAVIWVNLPAIDAGKECA